MQQNIASYKYKSGSVIDIAAFIFPLMTPPMLFLGWLLACAKTFLHNLPI